MHHIHHTHAIILGSKDLGESNKTLYLYTRELGLISARVQSVRKESSKLRYALQDYSYAEVDLVRGREVWRVTTAVAKESFLYTYRDLKAFTTIRHISSLVIRLCTGEERNEKIFEDLLLGLRFYNKENLTDEDKQKTELALVLRILHHLGYIGETEKFASILEDVFDPSREVYQKLEKKTILFEINRALKESHL